MGGRGFWCESFYLFCFVLLFFFVWFCFVCLALFDFVFFIFVLIVWFGLNEMTFIFFGKKRRRSRYLNDCP